MDVIKCKAFVTAADEGSFTAAGKLLGYTPSGISQLVSAMETELGFSLLTRKSHGVVLTREGEYMYPYAVEFLSKEAELYSAATELSGMYKGNVMIATYSSIAAHTLPGIIKDFTDEHPSINIQIEETTKNKIEKMVASGKADLAFCSKLSNPSYDWFPFGEDPMVAVLPKDHPYADKECYLLIFGCIRNSRVLRRSFYRFLTCVSASRQHAAGMIPRDFHIHVMRIISFRITVPGLLKQNGHLFPDPL